MKIIDWLLSGDVSIQYHVHKYLLDSETETIKKLRGRISEEGFGYRFLQEKHNDGYLGILYYSPKWTSLHYTMYDLYWLGIDPSNETFKENAVYLLNKLWFNKGEVRKKRMQDLCVAGMLLQICAYAKIEHPKLEEIVDYILKKHFPDGGWNCQWEIGDTKSSLHTTITVLEAIKEYIDNGYSYKLEEIKRTILPAEDFILRKELFKSERTKEVINEQFIKFPFPFRWHYDIVRALTYFVSVERPYDPRMEDALEIISKSHKNGFFKKFSRFQGRLHFTMEVDKQGSKWNTYRALRVLKYYKPEQYNMIKE